MGVAGAGPGAAAPADGAGRSQGERETRAAEQGRRVNEADLRRHVETVTFAPSDAPDRIGVEVEMIAVDRGSHRAAPVEERVLPLLEGVAAREGWAPAPASTGAPGFLLPGGDALTLEPGGQLEVATVPEASVGGCVDRLQRAVGPVLRAGREAGVAFVTRGMDPLTPLSEVPLAFDAPRYRRQATHYDRIGPWGRRMMRQSAAIHVNLDLGPRPALRWTVANRAAPSLLALFANSPSWQGEPTGHRSWRAAQWRRLDPSRTGYFPGCADPVAAYLDFALDADAFLVGDEDAPARTFHEALEAGVTPAEWAAHLTTLFPEVRPRGYLEIRAFDALPPRWWAVPAVVCVGLLYHGPTLERARAELPEPEEGALERAGRLGVEDPDVRREAVALFELALEGAEALTSGTVDHASLETARRYLERYPQRGRDPGHDPEAGTA